MLSFIRPEEAVARGPHFLRVEPHWLGGCARPFGRPGRGVSFGSGDSSRMSPSFRALTKAQVFFCWHSQHSDGGFPDFDLPKVVDVLEVAIYTGRSPV